MDKSNQKSLYWILARVGGFDGVSLQTFEYMNLLNSLNLHVDVITGCEEVEYGKPDYGLNDKHLVEKLSFKHPDSDLLYYNSFAYLNQNHTMQHGSKWPTVFENHKTGVKKSLEKVLSGQKDAPVIVHNLLSLRHMHPAAAIAIKELVEENPYRKFVNFAPDSDWERPQRVRFIKDPIKHILSPNYNIEEFGAPYKYDNLYHIVLNFGQRKMFTDKFGIAQNQVFDLPDHLYFDSPKLKIADAPDKGFIDYLGDNCIHMKDRKIEYTKGNIDADTVFFVCPVRPVERKKIRTAIFLVNQYQYSTGKHASIIIPHPNGDELDYFEESVYFANRCGVEMVYLGDSLKLSNDGAQDVWILDDFYKNMAALNSIGMVTSNRGGWENAINELLKAGIPTLVNPQLNSYPQIVEQMGFNVLGLPLQTCFDIIANTSLDRIGYIYAKEVPEVQKFISWVNKYGTAHSTERNDYVKQEYEKAYNHLSSKAREKDIGKLLDVIM